MLLVASIAGALNHTERSVEKYCLAKEQGTESHCEVAAGLLLFFFLVPPDTATEIISSANVSVALAQPPAECATWPELDNSMSCMICLTSWH